MAALSLPSRLLLIQYRVRLLSALTGLNLKDGNIVSDAPVTLRPFQNSILEILWKLNGFCDV